jgi:hypothetical protein
VDAKSVEQAPGPTSPTWRPKVDGSSILGAACLVGALVWFMHSGLLREGGGRHNDAPYWYVAARCWVSGSSPYELEQFRRVWTAEFGERARGPFVYPPTASFVFIPMGLMGWDAARLYLDLVNVAALAAMIGALLLLGQRVGPDQRSRATIWLPLVLTSSATLSNVYTGQTSLIAACGICLVYAGSARRSEWLTFIGYLLASMKPQLSLPAVAWAALLGPCWRGMVASVVASAGSLLLLLLGRSPVSKGVLESLTANVALPENATSEQYGVGQALGALGLSLSAGRTLMLVGGIASAAILYLWLRARGIRPRALFDAPDGGAALVAVLTTLVCLSFLAAPVHVYDLALLSPIFLLLTILRGRLAVVAGMLALVFWRPAIMRIWPGASPAWERPMIGADVAALTAVCVVWLSGWLRGDTPKLERASTSWLASRRCVRSPVSVPPK